jgi:hypothetical protein
MANGWTIGGSPRRQAGTVCHNEKCSMCDIRTKFCRNGMENCRDRLKNERFAAAKAFSHPDGGIAYPVQQNTTEAKFERFKAV